MRNKKTQGKAYAGCFNTVLHSFRVYSTGDHYYEINIGLYMVVNKNGKYFIKKTYKVCRESGSVKNI